MTTNPRFFGIHYDFHALDDSVRVGEELDARELARFLRTVRPEKHAENNDHGLRSCNSLSQTRMSCF